MRALRDSGHTKFVSFSGIDGAGKSTQIEALCARMKEDGLRVVLIRFWDDIAKLTRIRETTGHVVFRGDKGVGTISAPINRRDKNIQSWLMTAVRLFLYFIDAISIRFAVEKALRSEADLVVFDRYTFDELANLSLRNTVIRRYVRLIMMIVPMPHISYVLDADPVKARARKPEYPLEFLYTNRKAYLDLSELIGGMTVIAPMSVQEVERAVLGHALARLSFRSDQRMSDVGIALNVTKGEATSLDGSQTGRVVL